MKDLYEYQRVMPREARDPDDGGDDVPLGKPDDYEDLDAYQAHKDYLARRAYAKTKSQT